MELIEIDQLLIAVLLKKEEISIREISDFVRKNQKDGIIFQFSYDAFTSSIEAHPAFMEKTGEGVKRAKNSLKLFQMMKLEKVFNIAKLSPKAIEILKSF
jgi:hypothetical protein